MRLFLLSALTMLAFAANSVLNRMGIFQAGMDPAAFALIRLISGALSLTLLSVGFRRTMTTRGQGEWVGVVTLLTYLFGFSFAYLHLQAGVGALLLFGAVQVTMFLGALLERTRIPPFRWLGAALAFAGLIWLLWPGQEQALPLPQAGMMLLAGLGWGLYSLAGRSATDPLLATTGNFLWALPLASPVLFFLDLSSLSATGVFYAFLSGAIASGLGYALWYAILPTLGATRAAVAQLTVPVITFAGGAVFLGEVPTLSLLLATLVVLSGVALAALAK